MGDSPSKQALNRAQAEAIRACRTAESPALDADSLARCLSAPQLKGWSKLDKRPAIRREFAFRGFGPAMKFIEEVAKTAELADHFPDWRNRYSTVWVTLETHAVHGVTQRDIQMATYCNALFDYLVQEFLAAAGGGSVAGRGVGPSSGSESRPTGLGKTLTKAKTWGGDETAVRSEPAAAARAVESADAAPVASSTDSATIAPNIAAPTTPARASGDVVMKHEYDEVDAVVQSAAATGSLWTWSDAERVQLTPESTAALVQSLADDATAPQRVTAIKLGGKSFDAASMGTLVNVLVPLTNLVNIDASDIIAGRHETIALEALGVMSEALGDKQFNLINLSDNALGEKGVRACEPLLRSQHRLLQLSLDNTGLSKDAMKLLVDILGANDGSVDQLPLERIHVHNNMMGKGGGKALGVLLAKCPSIKDIRISGTRMGDEGTAHVFAGLEASGASQLTSLNIRGCTIGDETRTNFFKVVARNTELKELDVGDAAGEEILVKLLKTIKGRPLAVLGLSGCELNPQSALILARLITSDSVKPNLRVLRIADNDELESAGAVALASGFAKGGEFPALEEVVADSCTIGSRGARALAKALRQSAPQLQLLVLGGNQIAASAVEDISEIFASTSTSVTFADNDDEEEEDDDDNDDDETLGSEEENGSNDDSGAESE